MNSQNERIAHFDAAIKKKGYKEGFDYFFEQKDGIWVNKNLDSIPMFYGITVIETFSWSEYLHTLREMISSQASETLRKWFSAFTRMYFLNGNPEKVRKIYDKKLHFGGKHLSMTTLGDGKVMQGIRSLLTVWNPNLQLPVESEQYFLAGTSGTTKKVTVFHYGLPFSRVLVHASHVVSEGYITGKIGLDDSVSLILRAVPSEETAEEIHHDTYCRVDVEETYGREFLLYGYIN